MVKARKENQSPEVQNGELSKLLSEYRDIAGYSVSQMADALCLSEKILVDLEDENFENLPQPPYIRGYLRNYAKLANAEPDQLITIYESLRGADPKELEYHFKKSTVVNTRQQKTLSPILIQVFFLALLLAIIAGIAMIPSVNNWIKSTWDSFSNQASTPSIESTDNPLLTGNMPIPTPLPIPVNEPELIEKTTLDSPQQSAENEKPITNDPTSESENTLTNDQKTEQAIVTNDSEQVDEPSTQPSNEADTSSIEKIDNETINLRLVFNEDVWMRIKDSNKKTVFEGLNPKGNSKILDLKKPLTFRVGNAPALSLFIDGELYNITTYIKGSVANFTLE